MNSDHQDRSGNQSGLRHGGQNHPIRSRVPIRESLSNAILQRFQADQIVSSDRAEGPALPPIAEAQQPPYRGISLQNLIHQAIQTIDEDESSHRLPADADGNHDGRDDGEVKEDTSDNELKGEIPRDDEWKQGGERSIE